jgi:polyribonucleotide nucleotidyltransferase
MNVKAYETARTALTKLEGIVKAEAKVDHRLARGAKRIGRLLALLKVAQGKYELVHSRKVPQKLAARKAKAKAKNGNGKKGKGGNNVVHLPVKKRAA